MLDTILKEKNMTLYQCAKLSGIPYTTLSEVVRGKTRIEKCSAETVYKLSKILQTSMEDLLQYSIPKRPDFEIFKSNVCHQLNDSTPLDFIINTLQKDDIRLYWKRGWHAEAFYILAMTDYLCRINDLPIPTKYEYIRCHSLKEPLYPRDILMASKLSGSSDQLEQSKKEAIPEFLKFNIIESEIENVY